MTKMLRTFHSVGHGGFSTEIFENFKIVYDCGSDQGATLIDREIENAFDKDEEIDAVFISHFHADHVNGLSKLLKHCKVKKLFLPLLHEKEQIQILIHNNCQYKPDDFIHQLMVAPLSAVSKLRIETSVVLVNSASQRDNEPCVPLFIDDIYQTTIESGVELKSRNATGWVFIPYNFQSSERSSQLTAALTRLGIPISTVSDFEVIWKTLDGKAKIRSAYEEVRGNFNTNSMVLFSGPVDNEINYISWPVANVNSYAPFITSEVPKAGCLYLGDYEAKGSHKWKELGKSFSGRWSILGIVQIPHHGSRHNYNHLINKGRTLFSVISCDKESKYCHPHSSTIKGIVMNEGIPVIITENPATLVQFAVVELPKRTRVRL